MEMLTAYEVRVQTTNELIKDTFVLREDNGALQHHSCKDGVIIVLTNNPAKIYGQLKDLLIESVTKLGPGYLM